MEPSESTDSYALQKTLEIPSHISCLTLGYADHLFVGSDDGSLRLYDLSSLKVLKAIRGLGSEVSSIICFKRSSTGVQLEDVWLASGSRIMKFEMDSSKMIQTADDALSVIGLGEPNTDDTLNELALSSNKNLLAFSMDSGVVGIVDLSTSAITRMKAKHESICGSVKFIPNWPREIVSGGYDTALLHFDFAQGTVLSSRKIPASAAAGGMALAPPFVMSTAMSPTGVLAAGTADGQLWLGSGGRKLKSSKKKKARKWQGLNGDEETTLKIAEGPVVAMAFDESGALTVSTLLGVISQFTLVYDEKTGSINLSRTWQKETENVKKVNALVVGEKRIIVGGLKADGSGVFEIWKR